MFSCIHLMLSMSNELHRLEVTIKTEEQVFNAIWMTIRLAKY